MNLSETIVNSLFCCLANKTHIVTTALAQSCGSFACEDCVKRLQGISSRCFSCSKEHPFLPTIKCAAIDQIINDNKHELLRLVQFKNEFEKLKENLASIDIESVASNNMTSVRNQVNAKTNEIVSLLRKYKNDYNDELEDFRTKLVKYISGVVTQKIAANKPKFERDISLHEYPNLVGELKNLENDIISILPRAHFDTSHSKISESFVGFLRFPDGYQNQSLKIKNGHLVSASQNGQLVIWNIERKKCVSIMNEGSGKALNCVELVPRGKLATGSSDHSIKIWNLNNQSIEKSFSEHTAPVNCLKYISNAYLLSGSDDGLIKIWSLDSDISLYTIEAHENGVLCLEIIISSGIFASGGRDYLVKVWSLESKACINVFDSQKGSILSLLALSNNILLSSSDDKTLMALDLEDKQKSRHLVGHAEAISFLKRLSNGQIIGLSNDSSIYSLYVETGESHLSFKFDSIMCIDVFDNNYLVCASADKKIRLIDLMNKKSIDEIDCHMQSIECLKQINNMI